MLINRLSKVLASCGVASRRKCEELIFAGKVEVNGEIIRIPQTDIDLKKDKILVNGKPVLKIEKKLYFLFNKPAGYLCTSLKVAKEKSVLNFFTDFSERLFTVGRLDKDTKGLLLVTNDGHFAQKVIHPSKNLIKEYLAKTDKELTEQHLKAIATGAMVEGTWVKPAHVKKVRKGTVKIAVKEGKKREVRILLENVGLKVLELKRIRIGGLTLGLLEEGAFRELTEGEKSLLISDYVPFLEKTYESSL